MNEKTSGMTSVENEAVATSAVYNLASMMPDCSRI